MAYQIPECIHTKYIRMIHDTSSIIPKALIIFYGFPILSRLPFSTMGFIAKISSLYETFGMPSKRKIFFRAHAQIHFQKNTRLYNFPSCFSRLFRTRMASQFLILRRTNFYRSFSCVHRSRSLDQHIRERLYVSKNYPLLHVHYLRDNMDVSTKRYFHNIFLAPTITYIKIYYKSHLLLFRYRGIEGWPRAMRDYLILWNNGSVFFVSSAFLIFSAVSGRNGTKSWDMI